MKLLIIFLALFISRPSFQGDPDLQGAWKNVQGNTTTIILIGEGYITFTVYTPDAFKETRGGTYKTEGDKIVIHQEFNTAEKELKTETINFQIKNNILHAGDREFDQVDNGKAALAGVWKITGRMNEGKITPMQQTGTRKTLKLLTGTRFQWFAINPEGNKFSGTGGGTYSFQNGKYIENIEFFSRDASRVGVSLVFDDHLEEGKWHHTGLSSKGDKIYEIWEKTGSK